MTTQHPLLASLDGCDLRQSDQQQSACYITRFSRQQGRMRRLAEECALIIEECLFTVEEAHDAAEASYGRREFVRPIIAIDGQLVSDGRPGEMMTRRLRQVDYNAFWRALAVKRCDLDEHGLKRRHLETPLQSSGHILRSTQGLRLRVRCIESLAEPPAQKSRSLAKFLHTRGCKGGRKLQVPRC